MFTLAQQIADGITDHEAKRHQQPSRWDAFQAIHAKQYAIRPALVQKVPFRWAAAIRGCRTMNVR